MTDKKYIIALDQGTTSSRALILDHDANVVSVAQREFTQIYPQAGWVEHNPMEIWATQSSTLNEAVAMAGITSDMIAGIGITNQRETTIVWAKFAQRAKNVKLAIFLYRANIIGCLDPCQCIDQRCAFYTKVTTYSGFGHASFQRF